MPPKKPAELNDTFKPIKVTKSQILKQQQSVLKSLTTNYLYEKKEREKDLKNLTRPLTRVNSLPVVYRHRLTKQLFSVSKSINFGFEPPIPKPDNNETLILDELPDDKTKEIKDIKNLPTPPPGSITTPPFSKSTIDKKDQKSLDDVKKDDHRTFIQKRVGKRKLDNILNTLDPLGEDSVEIAKEERYRAHQRRFLFCFVLPIIAAFCVWVLRNVMPFEYFPGPKRFNRVIPILASFIYCEKKAPGIDPAATTLPARGSRYNAISNYYLSKMRAIVSSLSNGASVQGSWVVKTMEIVDDRIKLEVFLLPRYYQVCPGLLWLGMDFSADPAIIRRQLVLFANEVLFLEMSRLYDVECSLQSKDILDEYVEPFKTTGELYGQLLESERPNRLALSYEGIIRTTLQQQLGTTASSNVGS